MAMTVRGMLERLQKDNYKRVPERPAEKGIEKEIEEMKQRSMIKAVPLAQGNSIKISRIEDDSVKNDDIAKRDETEALQRIEQKLVEIETIKREMMSNGNFMKRLYEIKQAEKKLLPILYDAKIKGIELSNELKARIAVAAPKAALLD